MKIKISVIAPDLSDACALYRSMGPYKKLREHFDVEFFSGKDGFVLWDSVLNADVVMMQRPHGQQSGVIAQTIKSCGKKLIVDWDDDLTVVPTWNPNAKAFDNCKPHIENLAKLSDIVTVSSKALEQTALKWGAKKVEIVRNAIDDEIIKAFTKKEPQKVVAWRGSNTHIADMELAKKPIHDFLSKGYQVAFFGDRPSWSYEFAHRFYGVTDYCQFLATLYALQPEYMIVTLADHPFNHAKSDIAAQECYTIGAKLLHNGIGEFAGLPEWQEPRKLSDENAKRIDIIRSLVPPYT